MRIAENENNVFAVVCAAAINATAIAATTAVVAVVAIVVVVNRKAVRC